MRPALWQAVADNLRESHPDLRLVAKDDFNATLRAKGSTARLGLFYQPREGDVPGEGHAFLLLDGRTEMGAIAPFLAEQEGFERGWYAGPIGGAFQGYTLGNILSAQFFDAALKAHPEIPAEMGQGKFI